MWSCAYLLSAKILFRNLMVTRKRCKLFWKKANSVSELFKKLNQKFAKVNDSVSNCLPIAQEEAEEIEHKI